MPPKHNVQRDIALRLISEWLGESFYNRTWAEYVLIANNIPSLDACYAYINQRLADMAKANFAPYEICYFKSGDQYIQYEPFATSLSKETIRRAIVKSGFRALQKDPELTSYLGLKRA